MSDIYGNNLVNEVKPRMLQSQSGIVKDDAYIPDEYTFIQIQPDGGGASFGFESNQTVLFKFDSQTSYVALSRSTVEFDIVNLGATSAKLDGNAHSVFSRVQLRSKYGVVIDDDQGYNARVLMERQMTTGAEYTASHWEELSDNLNTAEVSSLLFLQYIKSKFSHYLYFED